MDIRDKIAELKRQMPERERKIQEAVYDHYDGKISYEEFRRRMKELDAEEIPCEVPHSVIK